MREATKVREDDITEETMKAFCNYDGVQLLEPEVTQFRGKCTCPCCLRAYSVYINVKSKEVSVKEINNLMNDEQHSIQVMRVRAYARRLAVQE